MLTFFNSEHSPNCLKTKILLLELGLPYEQRDFDYDALRAGALGERFPNAKLPALTDGDIAIAESSAIALHLAMHHGKLVPADEAGRALTFQALGLEAALQAPVIGGFGIFGELGKPEPERDMARVGKLMPEAQRVAAVLGAVLGERDFFAGELSIADIQLWPGATKAIQYDVFSAPPANLVAWDQRMAQRASVREARQGYPQYRG